MSTTYKNTAWYKAQEIITEWVAKKKGVITACEVGQKITKPVKDGFKKPKNALRRADTSAKKKIKAEINAWKITKKTLFKEIKVYLKANPQMAKLFIWSGWAFCV